MCTIWLQVVKSANAPTNHYGCIKMQSLRQPSAVFSDLFDLNTNVSLTKKDHLVSFVV